MSIIPLSQDTARLLRAHVVISTPLSVVKELVDNAIDAKASSIEVLISPNLVDRIEVRDNGGGIDPSDYEALGRNGHTSKLASFEELKFIGGASLGFRGEAIAAMCAVAKVIVTTRTAREKVAAFFELQNLGEGTIKPTRKPAPVGTTLAVVDLFSQYPVRRKANIKNSRSILTNVKRLLTGYALARPCLRIFLREIGTSSSSPLWSYAPRPGSRIKEAALSLFGHDLASQCTESFAASSSAPASGECLTKHTVRIDAFVPGPDAEPAKISKGSFLAVDSRPVSSSRGTFKKITSTFRRHIRHCLDRSGDAAIKDPFIVLNITCSPGTYDVNLEPAKDDVLFIDEQTIIDACEKLFQKIYKTSEPTKDQRCLVDHAGREACHDDVPFSADAPKCSQAFADGLFRSQTVSLEINNISMSDMHHMEPTATDTSGLPRSDTVPSILVASMCPRNNETPPAIQQIARQAENWTVDMDAADTSEDGLPPVRKAVKDTTSHAPSADDEEDSRLLEGVNPWVLAKINAATRQPRSSVLAMSGPHLSPAHSPPHSTGALRDVLCKGSVRDDAILPDDSISVVQDLDILGSRRSFRSRPDRAEDTVPGGLFRSSFTKERFERPSRSKLRQRDDTDSALQTPPPSARAESSIRTRRVRSEGKAKGAEARCSMRQTRLPSWKHKALSRSNRQGNSTSPPPQSRKDQAKLEREFLESMGTRLPRPPSPAREKSHWDTVTLPSFNSALTALDHNIHGEINSTALKPMDDGSRIHRRESFPAGTREMTSGKSPAHSKKLTKSGLLECPTKDTLGLVTWAPSGPLERLSPGYQLSGVDNYMLTGTIHHGLRTVDIGSKAHIEKVLDRWLTNVYGERMGGYCVEIQLGEMTA